MEHDLVKAVESARVTRGRSPFVGIMNGHGTMMFRRSLVRDSLKGLRVIDAQVEDWRGNKALVVHAIGEGVKARRVYVPETGWRCSPLLRSWQLSNLRDMGRCDCYEFGRYGDCKHLETRRAPKDKHSKAIAKLEKSIPREWTPQNPAAVVGAKLPEHERQKWLAWHLQKRTRREVMRIARRGLSSTAMYAELAKVEHSYFAWTNYRDDEGEPKYELLTGPVEVKKWGEVTARERDRMHVENFHDYLTSLWKFCGLVEKPDWWERYAGDETVWGYKRYEPWLEDLHDRQTIKAQIEAINVAKGETT